jgi:hypothetical protein
MRKTRCFPPPLRRGVGFVGNVISQPQYTPAQAYFSLEFAARWSFGLFCGLISEISKCPAMININLIR